MLENLTIKTLESNKKIAIVLFNLGGPDSLNKVKYFLFNLFYDRAIINLPNPLRFLIAKAISIIRNKESQKIYSLIGGKSPILAKTAAQKLALTEKLQQHLQDNFKIFITMRYTNPRSTETIDQIKQYDPSEIILLPLYPQFSSTTTGSSIKDFVSSFCQDQDRSVIPIKTICCYPLDENFIKSHKLLIEQSLKILDNSNAHIKSSKFNSKSNFRILFSAHGLPVKIIKSGDPYQWQIEQTVKKIVDGLNINNLDYRITYQSRVGPLEWLKPNTIDEIEIAGKENKSLIIVPITFVSEHVETLVELDIEYRQIANKYQIKYIRVPTLGINEIFIDSLTKMVLNAIHHPNDQKIGNSVINIVNNKICPAHFTMCLCRPE